MTNTDELAETDRQTDMLRQDYSYGKYIYKNKTHMTTRYDL